MQPLAEILRPKTLDEFIGQLHLVGKNKPIRTFLEQNKIISMLFWGPPGSGKTTLARLISHYVDIEFIPFSAVTGNVKQVREIIEKAIERKKSESRDTLLFIDEIHRFNKAQQDALLPFVEDGTIVLIGATTENPGFEVNAALRSRMQTYRFYQLTQKDIEQVIDRIIQTDDEIKIDQEAKEFLISFSDGDARRVITAVDNATKISKNITKNLLEDVLQRKIAGYDKSGDNHYDTISAFIKSMRGSQPDATLHYLARMLNAGEDPIFIARRMVIFASEDIGNIRPNALVLATSTMQAVQMIGMPESKIILAQCATYLASCPKSIASYKGILEAMHDVENIDLEPIPLHLRNASNTIMKKEGYGKDHVRYPWLEKKKGNKVNQDYLPKNLKGKNYYDFKNLSEE